jgi:Cu/Ag efflux pump CusA
VIIGCALLALVLFALLYAWRTALIALAAFVVSLTAAALVLTLTDASFNALLFAGLAAAVIAVIDDGVIDVERISRGVPRRGAPRGLAARATIVRDAASQTRSPMAYATLMAALVALPVFFLQGLTGSFFDPAAGPTSWRWPSRWSSRS